MGSPATPVELGMDCHRGYRDTGFFRDDPVFRGRAEGSNFFQSGRHKGEEHFWRNIHKTTPTAMMTDTRTTMMVTIPEPAGSTTETGAATDTCQGRPHQLTRPTHPRKSSTGT